MLRKMYWMAWTCGMERTAAIFMTVHEEIMTFGTHAYSIINRKYANYYVRSIYVWLF
jgi:hypothetical protein